MDEASIQDTPYGRNPAEEGWFVLNLADALAVRNEEKGGAMYPLEPQGEPFTAFGVNVHVVWPGEPSALVSLRGRARGVPRALGRVHARSSRSRSGRCGSGTSSIARPGRIHIFVGAGDGPCAILMIGGSARRAAQLSRERGRREVRRLGFAKETPNPDEAYADWPGEFVPVRLPWPVE